MAGFPKAWIVLVMIDGVKIQAYGTTRRAWMENPNLDFVGRFSMQSGEVLQSSTLTANCRGANFRIPPKEELHFEGSLHRFANQGAGNGNDFSQVRLEQTIRELEKHYNIVPYVAELSQLEFGVNVLLPFDAKTLVKSLISSPRPGKERGFVQMNAHRLNLGKVAKFSDFQIKIYDKGTQQATNTTKAEKRLLRIEIKAIRARYLRKLGIRFLDDLKRPEIIAKLGEVLSEMIDSLIIYGGVLAGKNLSDPERMLELQYSNPLFWESKSASAREKHKARFFALLAKYNATPQNEMLKSLVAAKWKELTGQRMLRIVRDKKTDTTVTRQCVQCGADISHKRHNAKYCSDKCRKNHHRGVVPTKPEKLVLVRVCENCGVDISHKKEGAKYCSDKCRMKRHRLKINRPTFVTTPKNQVVTKQQKPPPKCRNRDTSVTTPLQDTQQQSNTKNRQKSATEQKVQCRKSLKKKRSNRPRDA